MRETTLVHLVKDGCVLMMHRISKKHDINHGKWIGVGGKFEPGETPEECMRREVWEETGLTVLAVQQRLNVLGYGLKENAKMDEATVAALKRIQAQYGASAYGGLDFCTIDLVQRAFAEYLYGGETDLQLQKAIEVLQ